jgi:hypothetical protein
MNPGSQPVPRSGGNFHATVTSPCNWTTTSDNSWINVDYGEGVGVGSVTYTVAPNPGIDPRQGALHIEGRLLTVVQAGLDCTITVDPASYNIGAAGGTFDLKIVANETQCPWAAVSTESWIVVGTANGSGAQTVTFVVSENTATSTRNAIIRVADERSCSAERETGARSGAETDAIPSPSRALPVAFAGAAPACPRPSIQANASASGGVLLSVSASTDCKWSVSTALRGSP